MPHHRGQHKVKVWDLPTRLFHWALVALMVVMIATGLSGRLTWHMMAGQGVLGLLLFRLAWGVVGSRTARFSQFVKGPKAALAYITAVQKGHARSIGHNPLGAYSVVAMLTVLLAQCLSGLFSTDDIFTQGPLAHLVSSGTVKLASSLHRWGLYGVLALICLHLAAIAFYRFAKGDDLIEAMISGKKSAPANIDGIAFASSIKAMVVLAAAMAMVWAILAIVPPAPAF